MSLGMGGPDGCGEQAMKSVEVGGRSEEKRHALKGDKARRRGSIYARARVCIIRIYVRVLVMRILGGEEVNGQEAPSKQDQ